VYCLKTLGVRKHSSEWKTHIFLQVAINDGLHGRKTVTKVHSHGFSSTKSTGLLERAFQGGFPCLLGLMPSFDGLRLSIDNNAEEGGLHTLGLSKI
jgi:hypothetical protein